MQGTKAASWLVIYSGTMAGFYGSHIERSFAWLGRNRRFSKDYQFKVQTPDTSIEIATVRLMLNRIAP